MEAIREIHNSRSLTSLETIAHRHGIQRGFYRPLRDAGIIKVAIGRNGGASWVGGKLSSEADLRNLALTCIREGDKKRNLVKYESKKRRLAKVQRVNPQMVLVSTPPKAIDAKAEKPTPQPVKAQPKKKRTISLLWGMVRIAW